jgi:zinc protease
LPAKIDAVNAAEVERVAAEHIDPAVSVVIAAGDRAKIEPELKKLAIGDIELRDADGNPVKTASAGAH